MRPATLNNWHSEGIGPTFHKLGRRAFYTRADLDSWVASCRRRSTAEHQAQESLAEKRKAVLWQPPVTEAIGRLRGAPHSSASARWSATQLWRLSQSLLAVD